MCIKERIKILSIYFLLLAIFQVVKHVDCESMESINGLRRTQNYGKFVDLRNWHHSAHTFRCEFPMNIVDNSRKVFATVHGGAKVPLPLGFEEFYELVKLPSGSPYQTLRSWMSNIVSFEYLRATEQIDEQRGNILRDNIQLGYNKLVFKSNTPENENWRAYKGLKDSSGKFTLNAFFDQENNNINQEDSVWNSAYMAQLLLQGRDAAPMNDRYVQQLLNYVKSKQAPDGSFHDSVNIPYYSSNGGNSSKVPLTAFTIATLLKYGYEQNIDTVDAGLNFLIKQLPNIDNYFKLAITAYTLSLYPSIKQSRHIDMTLQRLISHLINESDEFENKMFWRINKRSRPSSKIEAVQIETASYVLLAMMNCLQKREYYMDSILKINNWLSTENSSIRGFKFSHETVLALEAMEKVTTKTSVDLKTNISIELKSISYGDVELFNVNDLNINDLQQKRLTNVPTEIEMRAHGKGLAFVGISCQYVEIMDNVGKNYELSVRSELTSAAKTINIHIAVRAMAESANADVQGMTLLEVELPGGFEFRDEKQIYKELVNFGVKKVKLINERKIAVLYFDPLSSTSVQNFQVKGYLVDQGSHSKIASVQVYSYTSYDENYAIAYYNVEKKPKLI